MVVRGLLCTTTCWTQLEPALHLSSCVFKNHIQHGTEIASFVDAMHKPSIHMQETPYIHDVPAFMTPVPHLSTPRIFPRLC